VPQNLAHTDNTTIEVNESLFSPIKTVSLIQDSDNRYNFTVFSGNCQEIGDTLFKITNVNSGCKNNDGGTMPLESKIIENSQEVAEIKHVNSQLCCERITTHAVNSKITSTPDTESKIADIVFELPKCRRDLLVRAEPYFYSKPAKFNYLTFLFIFIFCAASGGTNVV